MMENCINSSNTKTLGLFGSDSSKAETRNRHSPNVFHEANNVLKDSSYVNMLLEKPQRPNPRTLSKVKRWMKSNELNQREAARLLRISQTKLSHYLSGKSKCRGWTKLEENMVAFMESFNENEDEDLSSDSESGFEKVSDSEQSPPVSISNESREDVYTEISEPPIEDEPDQWSKFSLNAIFFTRTTFHGFN